MAPTAGERLSKQKAAKQKKLLLLLIPVLVAALAVQGPRLMKHFSSAKEKTQAVQGQVAEGYEELAPGGVPTAPAEAPTADPAVAIAATQGLPNTDTPPEADEGELISFTRFTARDPFVQLVEDTTEEGDGTEDTSSSATDSGSTSDSGTTTDTSSSDSSSSSSSSGTDSGGTTDSGSGGDTSGGDEAQTTDVSISVNGAVVVVRVGDTFPPNDPAFKLVAVENGVAKIGLAGGSFSNGSQTINLQVGDSVTLISQPDGARFTIKIVTIA